MDPKLKINLDQIALDIESGNFRTNVILDSTLIRSSRREELQEIINQSGHLMVDCFNFSDDTLKSNVIGFDKLSKSNNLEDLTTDGLFELEVPISQELWLSLKINKYI